MTKLAVLSDIHANWYALECVINTWEYKSCGLVVFCGDAVGYYYHAEKVINYLKTNISYGIKGNHDEILQLFMESNKPIINDYTNRYGSGLIRTVDVISNSDYRWLINLPETLEITLENKTILVCHGSPLEKNGYIYQDSPGEIIESIFRLNYDCVIFGHSHYQFVFEKNNQIIVNAGAVGQPRDRGGYAGWVVITLNANSIDVQLQRTKFDVSRLLKDIKLFDPQNEYLSKVLVRG